MAVSKTIDALRTILNTNLSMLSISPSGNKIAVKLYPTQKRKIKPKTDLRIVIIKMLPDNIESTITIAANPAVIAFRIKKLFKYEKSILPQPNFITFVLLFYVK
jgi:hypothetical protein